MQTSNGYTIHQYGEKLVIHFLAVVSPDKPDEIESVNIAYQKALTYARKFNGKRFHNKKFGGGISFANIREIEAVIYYAQITDGTC